MWITYVFQPVQILVAFATNLTFVRLLLLHTKSAWVGGRGLRINDRKGTISILMQTLCLMTVSLVISATVSCDRI